MALLSVVVILVEEKAAITTSTAEAANSTCESRRRRRLADQTSSGNFSVSATAAAAEYLVFVGRLTVGIKNVAEGHFVSARSRQQL